MAIGSVRAHGQRGRLDARRRDATGHGHDRRRCKQAPMGGRGARRSRTITTLGADRRTTPCQGDAARHRAGAHCPCDRCPQGPAWVILAAGADLASFRQPGSHTLTAHATDRGPLGNPVRAGTPSRSSRRFFGWRAACCRWCSARPIAGTPRAGAVPPALPVAAGRRHGRRMRSGLRHDTRRRGLGRRAVAPTRAASGSP